MIETRTTDEDRGLRCNHCGRDIFRLCATWWISNHGDYCSRACAEAGSHELHAVISTLEKKWVEEAANDDRP